MQSIKNQLAIALRSNAKYPIKLLTGFLSHGLSNKNINNSNMRRLYPIEEVIALYKTLGIKNGYLANQLSILNKTTFSKL